MQNTELLIYGTSAAVAASAITITSGTRYKILGFLLTFLILGASVIQEPIFDLPLKALGGNLQIRQLLLYLLTAHVLVLSVIRFRLDKPLLTLPFEKYFYAFAGWLGCVLVYHYSRGDLGGRELRSVSEGILIVLIVYVNVKRYGDCALLRALGKALIIVASLSSVVALVQFFAKSDFFLIGSEYSAFAGRVRGKGLFSTEFLHSYTVATALFLVLLFVQSLKLRISLIPLLGAGIIVSFHRMSWILTAFLVVLYLIHFKRIRVGRVAVVLITCLLVIYVFVDQFTPILHDVQQSALYQSRLSSDTMTDRLKFNSMALDLSEKSIFWGVGSKQSSLYFFGMLSTGFGLKWARGEIGGIHNLYLELLFFYGLPLLILFGLFLGSMLRTWIKLIRNNSDFFVLQFGFGLMYCVLNFTNALALHTDLGILFAFIAGAGAFIGGRALNPSPDDLNLR